MKILMVFLMGLFALPALAGDLAAAQIAYEHGDYQRALSQFRSLAEQGNARAQAQYARMMALGQGMPADIDGSTDWYEKSAKQGDAQGQYGLAYSYVTGEGVPSPDMARGISLLEASDAQGYDRATTLLGEIYHGLYDKSYQDMPRARSYFERAATAGNAGAERNLGLMLINGLGGPAEPERAIGLLKKTADDDAIAAAALGRAYDEGMGVEIDKAEAAHWHTIAADDGYGPSQINLGRLYEQGEGVPQDVHRAAAYYRMAADQGFTTANYNLGNLFAYGDGIEHDYELAVINYAIAAIDGMTRARDSLDDALLDHLETHSAATDVVLREAPADNAAAYGTLAAGESVWRVRSAENGWLAVFAWLDGPALGYLPVSRLAE